MSFTFTANWKAYAFGVQLPLHGSRNFVAIRRSNVPARKFTISPYTRLKLDNLRVFDKLLSVDDKGLALPI